MTRERKIRFAAMFIGAAVLFGLEQGLGTKFYIAIPAGILAYVATLLALGLTLGSGGQTK